MHHCQPTVAVPRACGLSALFFPPLWESGEPCRRRSVAPFRLYHDLICGFVPFGPSSIAVRGTPPENA